MKKIINLIIVLTLWTVSSVQAQEFRVAAFGILETDLTARVSPMKDLNGDDCALIKVVMDKGFDFSGPLGIVKRIDKTAEIWLYVPAGTIMLTISHPQWGMIRDYKLPFELKGLTTYEMRLEATPKEEQQPIVAIAQVRPVENKSGALTKDTSIVTNEANAKDTTSEVTDIKELNKIYKEKEKAVRKEKETQEKKLRKVNAEAMKKQKDDINRILRENAEKKKLAEAEKAKQDKERFMDLKNEQIIQTGLEKENATALSKQKEIVGSLSKEKSKSKIKGESMNKEILPSHWTIQVNAGISTSTTFGMTVAYLSKIGFYARYASNWKSVSGSGLSCDDDGNLTNGGGVPYFKKGTDVVIYSMTAGATFRVGRSVYLMGGAGYGEQSQYWTTIDDKKILHDNPSSKGIATELGVMGAFGHFSISASVQAIQFKTAIPTIGLGFVF